MPEASTTQDGDLVRRIAQGDESALSHAYDAYGGLVYGLAHRILGNASDAQEVAQDVFVRLWKAASRFDEGRGSLATLLSTVTRNLAVDRLRSRRRHPAVALPEAEIADLADASPFEFSSTAEARGLVTQALAHLPERERLVVTLAYFGGLSQTEIADKLEMPLGTVKGRAREALRHLKEALLRTMGDGR